MTATVFKAGDHVRLDCGCTGKVHLRPMPWVSAYIVYIDKPGCSKPAHRPGSRALVRAAHMTRVADI